jgi:ubiquinone/menaquinone biosynthesis C-methylase UbiE
MDATGTHRANQAYSDAFSTNYEKHRGRNDPGGYHELLDELEADFVARFGTGRDVLEVGCGTGLILTRLSRFARSARGVDLSAGMLEKARARGLDVTQASATELPFDSESFDVTCSFKALAHIPEIETALAEMARVTRPGGTIIAEFYNPNSLRGLLKRFGPRGAIAAGADEGNVYTRYDSPRAVEAMLPAGCRLIASRGVRVLIPTAWVMRVPGLRGAFRFAERAACDTRLGALGGFWIAALRKDS